MSVVNNRRFVFNSNCYTYVVLTARTSIVDTLFWFVSWAIQSSSAFGTFNFLSLYWPFRILSWNLDFLYSIKSIWHIWKAIWFFIISCRIYFTYYVVRNVGLTNPSDLGLRKTWTVYRDSSPRDLHIMTLYVPITRQKWKTHFLKVKNVGFFKEVAHYRFDTDLLGRDLI